ncbi:hypothetical protein LTR10_012414 [Elasticomyces elasticus]|nr:hypothetical protein LTR10_012414 [Elasticomyces elasticus]KAK4965889.1 hypothetical protein LTR42_011903 [Elasticomyces elasticus]
MILILLLIYSTYRQALPSIDLHDYAARYHRPWRGQSKHIEVSTDISWTDFAYCTYATDTESLCNSVMLLESLHRLGVNADRMLIHSNLWNASDTTFEREARLLRRARDDFGAKLQAIEVLHEDNVADPTWASGFTKLLAFNQTQYKRVLSLDADATILRSMDEIFLMPLAPVAMPRAYWLKDKEQLSDQLALVQPSTKAFDAVLQRIAERQSSEYDMEIINALYGSSCAVLPHRPYNLLTGEFRSADHTGYLGSKSEIWDAESVMQEAKYVHFSDWPLPKPWLHDKVIEKEMAPKCQECAEKRVWLWLYEDFRERRKNVCGPEFVVQER